MKHIFSLAAFTAAVFCLVIFLTTLSNGILVEPRPGHEATTVRRVSDNGCHLHGLLLADGRGRLDVLAQLGDV
jgi:hypothetical protein